MWVLGMRKGCANGFNKPGSSAAAVPARDSFCCLPWAAPLERSTIGEDHSLSSKPSSTRIWDVKRNLSECLPRGENPVAGCDTKMQVSYKDAVGRVHLCIDGIGQTKMASGMDLESRHH